MAETKGRFWVAETDSDEYSASSAASEDETPTVAPKLMQKSKYAFESESESEEEKRVVKPSEQRYVEELRDVVRKTDNHLRIDDYTSVETDLKELKQIIEDKGKVIFTYSKGYPRSYLKLYASLEDKLNSVTNQEKREMAKTKAKSCSILQQSLKKELRDNNSLREAIASWRENPMPDEEEEEEDEEQTSDFDDSMDDDESGDDDDEDESSEEEDESSEEEESDEEDEESQEDAGPESSEQESSEYESDSYDESDFDQWKDSESSESSSEEEDTSTKLSGRAKWVLQPKDSEKQKSHDSEIAKKQKFEEKKKKEDEKRKKKIEEDSQEGAATPATPTVQPKELAFNEPKDMMFSLLELVMKRGVSDKNESVRQLPNYLPFCQKFGVKYEVFVYSLLISRLLAMLPSADANPIMKYIDAMLRLMENNPSLQLVAYRESERSRVLEDRVAEETADLSSESTMVPVSGDFAAYTMALTEDYIRCLRSTDVFSDVYARRLRDEHRIVSLAKRVQAYCDLHELFTASAHMAIIVLEFSCYQPEFVFNAIQQARALKVKSPTVETPVESSTETTTPRAEVTEELIDMETLVNEQCERVYKYGDERQSAKARLYCIQYYAQKDMFDKARDLLLISQLQDTIAQLDVYTMVHFNRTIAHLGLSAFRAGDMVACHTFLNDLVPVPQFGAPRMLTHVGSVRVLLGQGVDSNKDSSTADEDSRHQEEQRKLPQHMHIDIDLIETCYLISCLFIDVPNMVSDNASVNRISPYFKWMYVRTLKVFHLGPPDTNSAHVLAASKDVQIGDWSSAVQHFRKLSIWHHWPQEVSEKTLDMLTQRLKLLSLRLFLFRSSSTHQSVSRDFLEKMFELDRPSVFSEVSSAILQGFLRVLWTSDASAVVFNKSVPSRFDVLCMNYSRVLHDLGDSNEQVSDALHGEPRDVHNGPKRPKKVYNQNPSRHDQYRGRTRTDLSSQRGRSGVGYGK